MASSEHEVSGEDSDLDGLNSSENSRIHPTAPNAKVHHKVSGWTFHLTISADATPLNGWRDGCSVPIHEEKKRLLEHVQSSILNIMQQKFTFVKVLFSLLQCVHFIHVHVGKEKLEFQAICHTTASAKFPHGLVHKRTKHERRIFVAGFSKVFESLVKSSLVLNKQSFTSNQGASLVWIVARTSASESESQLEPPPEVAFVTGVVRRER